MFAQSLGELPLELGDSRLGPRRNLCFHELELAGAFRTCHGVAAFGPAATPPRLRRRGNVPCFAHA